ncbi:MAG TPA: hypothetical protein ENN65_00590 [Candidatus Hydrogenedentes bacterium]|nr:hypothetical protein [Candidatus Hydrogenedentota bacterium]
MAGVDDVFFWGGAEIPPAPVNVVLLSVDTLRADRLGCYGYPLNTTPNLDRFAEDALLFEDCVCDVPLTGPSFSAMLTSRHPRMIGMKRNGLRLPADIPTLVEQFQDAGYYTFCVQSNWTLKSRLSGLDRGFEVYDDDFHKRRWGLIKAERTADEVTRIALELLEQRDTSRPFFAWIHYSDPHAPYKMRRDYNPAGIRAWRFKKKYRVPARYDSEVAFTDAMIAPVLAALPENTAVLFVADHGEALFEHGYLGHGRRIHQPGIHIPLMIRAPGLNPGRTSVPAQGIDVGPTLLGLAGLPKVEGMLGLNLVGEEVPTSRARVFETYGGAVPRVPGAKALMADRRPLRQGVIQEGWKLVLYDRKEDLFYLPDDPGELKDMADSHPGQASALQAIVKQWDAATEHGVPEAETLDADDIEALRSLGYIE